MKRLRKLLHHRRVRVALAALLVLPVPMAVLGWWLLPPLEPAPFVDVASSGQLHDRDGGRLYVALSADETWSLPQAPEHVSLYLRQATVAAEDQRFYSHPGVDPVAILRAAGQNLRRAGVASGASTLTMQLVKLGGRDSRSPGGKLDQALHALRLEKSLDKEAILQAYLNRAPYGMNLIGAEAAAWRYFGKTAQTLTLPEEALIAGLPKAPSRLNPLSHPERARARRDYVLGRMYSEGYIDGAARDRALQTPVNASWHDFPRSAPHLGVEFAERLDRGESVTLTLAGGLQRELETRLPQYLKRFDGAITNGAILVADVSSGAVLARVASAGFHTTPGGGQVDGCRAIRSPGSTLKPFLFGLAMAGQQLYPSEVLLDDVLDYGRYAPGNFDGLFNGPVTATEALRFSLNVPAVALLERVGVGNFREFLRGAGLDSIDRPAEDYGLGLTLGNCEVSLEALARLYLSVASLGQQNALHLEADGGGSGAALFELGIARLLYDMLAQPFPDEPAPGLLRRAGNVSPVCWKTGTSTGYHDAWTFAFNRHYLVAVWLGNNSGRSARALVGAYAALPLAAEIFRSLPDLPGPAWPPALSGNTATLCAASGLPAGAACPERASAVLPDGLWLHRRCTLHAASQTGQTVLAARPATAAGWNLAAVQGAAIRDSERLVPLAPLAINSPARGAAYVLSGVAGGDHIPLSVAGDLAEDLHWFMDGRYLGVGAGGAPLQWALAAGEHSVTVQLPDGRRDTAKFTVLRPSELGTAP